MANPLLTPHSFPCLLLAVLCTCSFAVAEPQYRVIEGAGGVPLTVLTVGDSGNPPILFIHGLSQSHYAFNQQFASDLSEHYYLVTFDLRGHGASGKPWLAESYASPATWARDVAAVLEATGAQRPLVVGWSFGSLVALDYLREFGADKVAGLLFTGSIGGLLPFRAAADDATLAKEFQRVRQQQLSHDPRAQVAALDRMVDWLTAVPLPADERDMLRVTAARFPAYARRAIYARPFDNQDMLPTLEPLPMLIMMGSEDNSALLEDAAVMVDNHSNMRFSLFEGAGHSVFLERPRRFNQELRAFAARALPANEQPQNTRD